MHHMVTGRDGAGPIGIARVTDSAPPGSGQVDAEGTAAEAQSVTCPTQVAHCVWRLGLLLEQLVRYSLPWITQLALSKSSPAPRDPNAAPLPESPARVLPDNHSDVTAADVWACVVDYVRLAHFLDIHTLSTLPPLPSVHASSAERGGVLRVCLSLLLAAPECTARGVLRAAAGWSLPEQVASVSEGVTRDHDDVQCVLPPPNARQAALLAESLVALLQAPGFPHRHVKTVLRTTAVLVLALDAATTGVAPPAPTPAGLPRATAAAPAAQPLAPPLPPPSLAPGVSRGHAVVHPPPVPPVAGRGDGGGPAVDSDGDGDDDGDGPAVDSHDDSGDDDSAAAATAAASATTGAAFGPFLDALRVVVERHRDTLQTTIANWHSRAMPSSGAHAGAPPTATMSAHHTGRTPMHQWLADELGGGLASKSWQGVLASMQARVTPDVGNSLADAARKEHGILHRQLMLQIRFQRQYVSSTSATARHLFLQEHRRQGDVLSQQESAARQTRRDWLVLCANLTHERGPWGVGLAPPTPPREAAARRELVSRSLAAIQPLGDMDSRDTAVAERSVAAAEQLSAEAVVHHLWTLFRPAMGEVADAASKQLPGLVWTLDMASMDTLGCRRRLVRLKGSRHAVSSQPHERDLRKSLVADLRRMHSEEAAELMKARIDAEFGASTGAAGGGVAAAAGDDAGGRAAGGEEAGQAATPDRDDNGLKQLWSDLHGEGAIPKLQAGLDEELADAAADGAAGDDAGNGGGKAEDDDGALDDDDAGSVGSDVGGTKRRPQPASSVALSMHGPGAHMMSNRDRTPQPSTIPERRVRLTVRVRRVMLLVASPGTLDIRDDGMTFTPDAVYEDKTPGDTSNQHVAYREELKRRIRAQSGFTVAGPELASVELRRYLLEHLALEVFTTDSRSYFIAFADRKERTRAERTLRACNAPCLSKRLDVDAEVQKLSRAWQKRRVSNFEYLMRLNRLAGRSFNDVAQYPVRVDAGHSSCVVPRPHAACLGRCVRSSPGC